MNEGNAICLSLGVEATRVDNVAVPEVRHQDMGVDKRALPVGEHFVTNGEKSNLGHSFILFMVFLCLE